MGTPCTVVLFGATGDLSKRKLLPGLLHLFLSGLNDDLRIVGTSLDELTPDEFRSLAHVAIREHSTRELKESDWLEFAARLDFVPLSAGPEALAEAVARCEDQLPGADPLRLHYLSVPPKAALSAVSTIASARLVERSRVIMEKPFRFANGLFEPIWHRNNISHIEIDVPETHGLTQRGDFYEATGAYRDMVVTHLFQILAFTAMEPPTALEPSAISREKNKVFRSMLPIQPSDVVRGQYLGYRDEPGVNPNSETETFIALKCYIDNWRWAGVPFYLRTGKRMAEGARIISIAFREPPQSMFPANSGVRDHGPDHLTFDLSDNPRLSLSFYGKRPGPGMQLDKLSMQFAMQDTTWAGSVLEAYERLIYDAIRGDRTLFTSADGIERLWEVSQPLIDNPPVVRPYNPGTWGPNQIHQLIAPFAWRLPFERPWREKKQDIVGH